MIDVSKEIKITYKIFLMILFGTFVVFCAAYISSRHYYDKRYEIFGIVTQQNQSKIGTFIKINNVDFDFWGLSDQQKQNIQKGDSIYKPMGEKYFMLFGKDANGVYHVKDTIPFW